MDNFSSITIGNRLVLISLAMLIVLMPFSVSLTYKDSLEVHNYKINKVECSDNYLRVLVKSETTKNFMLLFKVFSNEGNINIYTNQRLNKFNSDYFLVNTNLRCNSLLKVEVNGYADIKLKNKENERIIYINYEPGYQFNYKENKIPDSLLPIVEPQATNEYTSYIYLGSKSIYSKNSRNEELYYIQDSLNSNSIVVNSNGNLVSLQDYEPYGNNIELSPYTDTRFKFTNKELDKDSDLYYFGARYYDSGIGRFITNDPVFNPVVTPYAYANNNPIMYIDLTGEKPSSLELAKSSPEILSQFSNMVEKYLPMTIKDVARDFGVDIPNMPTIIFRPGMQEQSSCIFETSCNGNEIVFSDIPIAPKLNSLSDFYNTIVSGKVTYEIDEESFFVELRHTLNHYVMNSYFRPMYMMNSREITDERIGDDIVFNMLVEGVALAKTPSSKRLESYTTVRDQYGAKYQYIFPGFATAIKAMLSDSPSSRNDKILMSTGGLHLLRKLGAIENEKLMLAAIRHPPRASDLVSDFRFYEYKARIEKLAK